MLFRVITSVMFTLATQGLPRATSLCYPLEGFLKSDHIIPLC